ncbi:MAG: hypothetical protein R3D67_17450 [Hyphomicrobiaceae bacterium]
MATLSATGQDHARDIENRVRTTGAQISEKAAQYASKASDKLEGVMEDAERTAHNLAEQGREAGEHVTEVAGNMKTAIDKSVRDQPIATLAVAAALGFVIGALWKS